jgi:hypothetical protein
VRSRDSKLPPLLPVAGRVWYEKMAKAFFENSEGQRIQIGQDGVVRIARRSNDSAAQNRRRLEEGSGILWREEEDVDGGN